ncbi:MAG: choice-of-anchor D domain-containing protein [Bacteroidetes bacterium]|nr:choice-of-anchor D domain-containing protein [Bacteroidota bacterium]
MDGTTSNWIAPGSVTVGSSCSGSISLAEIEIRGNNLVIQDGDAIPELADHSDFGIVNLTNTVSRTFTVYNTGSAPLNITDLTVFSSDFTIGSLTPSSPILPGNSATFEITFSPLTSGIKTAIVKVISDDCDENEYDFVIIGVREDCFSCNSQNTTSSVIINIGYNDNTNSALGIGATGAQLDDYTETKLVRINTSCKCFDNLLQSIQQPELLPISEQSMDLS